MAQGSSAEERKKQKEQRAGTGSCTIVSQKVDNYTDNREESFEYDHHHAGSTALLMQTRPREAPAVEHHYSFLYQNLPTSIERRCPDGRVYPQRRNSPQQCSRQQSPQTDYSQQQADAYAVQQYQRMLLREQERRNRELQGI